MIIDLLGELAYSTVVLSRPNEQGTLDDASVENLGSVCDAIVEQLDDLEVMGLVVAVPRLSCYLPPGGDTPARISRWAIGAHIGEHVVARWAAFHGIRSPGWGEWDDEDEQPERRCTVCGCTDDRACPGGCSWAQLNPNVCSACWDKSEAEIMAMTEHVDGS